MKFKGFAEATLRGRKIASIPQEIMEEYRKEAIRNVRRTRGKINLDDLIARNNREFAEQKLSTKGSMSDDIVDEYTIDDYDFMEDTDWQE